MESNKSKAEFRNDLQNRVESLLYDTLNQDFRNRKDVCKALQDIVDEALAHPQQSEATLTDHAISIGTPIQTKAAASEGEPELIWDGTYDEDNYLTVTPPSEPAALKEFYCIGDKDNLFQCEEQCEDCKKGESAASIAKASKQFQAEGVGQAADWDKRSKVVIELSKEVDDVLTFYPAGETTDEALAAIFDKYAPMFQPYEPAAPRKDVSASQVILGMFEDDEIEKKRCCCQDYVYLPHEHCPFHGWSKP